MKIVQYNSYYDIFDGVKRFEVYEVISETDTHFEVPNVYNGFSLVEKDRFVIVEDGEIEESSRLKYEIIHKRNIIDGEVYRIKQSEQRLLRLREELHDLLERESVENTTL